MKYTIWSNDDVDTSESAIEEYRNEVLDPEYEYSDNDIIQFIYEDNDTSLEEEKRTLQNIELQHSHTILVTGILGLWNGRPMGYKLIKDADLSRIFDVTCGDYVDFYADMFAPLDTMEIQCSDAHHDGTNHYVFRELGTDDPDYDDDTSEMLYLIESAGRDPEKQNKAWEMIKKHTFSLYPYVQKHYGWPEDTKNKPEPVSVQA